MKYPVEIRRSQRRTLALSVERNLCVLVKAPLLLPDSEIETFLAKHGAWIERHLKLRAEANKRARSFSEEELEALGEKTDRFLQGSVAHYAARMGVVPAGVKVTRAAARWGSCSAKNRLCFSCRIALLPPDAAEYIVVHELAHIRQKNHGPRFYAEIAPILPDYKRRIALLRQAERELGL